MVSPALSETPSALPSPEARPGGATPPLRGARRALVLFVLQGLPLLGLGHGLWRLHHTGISGLEVGLLVGMYLLTMTGVELGFHRYFSHRTFETTRPLRAGLLVLGSMAGQGSALLWSGVHRWHHAHTDVPGDLHSPTLGRQGAWQRVRGFFWSQFLWYLDAPAIARFGRFLDAHRASPETLLASAEDSQESRLARTLPDLLRDAWLVRLNQRYGLWVLLGFALPAAVGGLATGTWDGALGGLVWGGFVRFFLVQQVTFAINSVTHTVGTRPLETRDDSRNNAVMAVLTLGAGWHNNHHAFPGSAFTGLRWWQVDPLGLLLRLLARLGWVWDVRAPSPEAIAARLRR
ncbi:acyl-CoA desaturase [Pyxidicoccus xibeiensis]|uniref:acyl-CoA desaturase n=1 Tax=Pyxidicoccus xibeiensis TaxID=2906759 RepID=UPI0020A81AEC|nr:fatty acid desaturase [Pyxidicoccus xibeiensis]MCP3138224.1 fatty acid desaturase [Pyxidicoccus xibeiensis]